MAAGLLDAFDRAAGLPADFCTVCCGPSPRGMAVVVLNEGGDLGRCPACDRPVDCEGQSVGMFYGGELHLKVIVLEKDEA